MPKCIECEENFATLDNCPYCQRLVCSHCYPEHEYDCNLDNSDLEDDWDEDEDSDLEDEDWEDSDLEDEDEDF